jgi:transcription elongation factor GreA
MNNQSLQLTQKQYDDLVERKNFLDSEAIPNNSLEIEKAKDFGDLSENAEYHAAKDLQSKLISESNTIGNKINRATIIKISSSTDSIQIGSTVKVIFLNENDTFSFLLIGENGNGVDEIDVQSKLGQSVYGKTKGEEFSYDANDALLGELRYKILDIL